MKRKSNQKNGWYIPMGLAVIVGVYALSQHGDTYKVSANIPTTQTSAAVMATDPNYKNGSYTGSVADAYYGPVQVEATVHAGKVTNVQFLQYPNTHSTSVYINQQAMPMLVQEAIQAQNASVNGVSGATYTSQAFQQSLASALSKA